MHQLILNADYWDMRNEVIIYHLKIDFYYDKYIYYDNGKLLKYIMIEDILKYYCYFEFN